MNRISNSVSCTHYGNCSGCSLDLITVKPPIWQDCCDYFSAKNLPHPLHFYQGPPLHWRTKAKLAVRGTCDDVQIGLFKTHSHDVVSIPFCQIHHPTINQAVDYIKELIKIYRIAPYNETDHKGELRYLQLVVERTTGKVQITFVLNQNDFSDEQKQKWQAILNVMENGWASCHSVWINFNPKKTNTIFGDHWLHCFGMEVLWDTFLDRKVCFHPASFIQANLPLFEKMLGHIKLLIPSFHHVVEFYAGVGAIGLSLAPFCQSMKCVEINPQAESCFLKSKECSSDKAEQTSFFVGPSEKFLYLLENADTVIVDPPHKGLCREVLSALQKTSTVQQLIYISCGWQSFKRDCDALLSAGWKLKSAAGYWFFPGSNQIEILAEFCV